MATHLFGEPFDPWRALADYQSEQGLAGKVGATSVFVGTMRDFNQGAEVKAMQLEHYPAMTQQYLETIEEQLKSRWPILDALLIHRFGEITPGEPIVLIAVWSAHRAEAMAACHYAVEELKARAPFWKKEITGAGERWVVPGEAETK